MHSGQGEVLATPPAFSLSCKDLHARGRARHIVQFTAEPVATLGQIYREGKDMDAWSQLEQQLLRHFKRRAIQVERQSF